MTIKKALSQATKKLKGNEIDSASLDAEILLSFVLQKPKELLYTHSDYQLTKTEQKKFEKLIKRRMKFEPTSYLIGYKEFYGLKFLVNRHVMVPRPESEKIIDETLNIIDTKYKIRDTCYVICDIGTGSGCLIISLAKKLQELNIIDKFELIATDVSKKALKVTEENAKIHQVEKFITFLKGDLLKPLKNKRVDIIITNLPYLTKADLKNEPSIKKEPKKALIGDYFEFFNQLKKLDSKPVVTYEDQEGIKIK